MTDMNEESHRAWEPSRVELAISVISGILFIVEIIVCFFFYYNAYALDIVMYSGWILLVVGFIIMSLPKYVLKERGGIPEGKSWVHTTTVVDKGIYGVVRHPIYVGWALTALALMLISQHWITVLLGALPFIVIVNYILVEDRNNVEKFGEPYVQYSERVPKMNFLVGLVRYYRQRS
ncbi:MAG: isoprenylcysteine carboxylmethyltransferase family protein [Candidatus Thorarchaeota archaeon]